MWVDNDEDMNAGDVGFLIEISPQGREDRTVIRATPGRTNMSNERKLTGWLGESNNVSTSAAGVGRVTKVNKAGDRALVDVLDGEELRAALEELGHPDMLD